MSPEASPRWRGRAFGIEVASTFSIPGVADRTGPMTSDATVVAEAPGVELDAARAGGAGQTLEEVRAPDRRLVFRMQESAAAGYVFSLRRFGRYGVSHDGRSVVCAPARRTPWYWERFVSARLLPLASVLRGHECLHASAVSIEGRNVAFLAAAGHGKTSIAVHLAVAGASIVTDDVLAFDHDGHGVRCHPGPDLVSVRGDEYARLSPDERERLGERVGRGAKVYLRARVEPTSRPLHAVYLLERRDPNGPARIEELRIDPPAVFASCFITVVRTPARLRLQLDACAALARLVPAFRVVIPAGATARATTTVIAEHAARQA